jgi:hypothetical protein
MRTIYNLSLTVLLGAVTAGPFSFAPAHAQASAPQIRAASPAHCGIANHDMTDMTNVEIAHPAVLPPGQVGTVFAAGTPVRIPLPVSAAPLLVRLSDYDDRVVKERKCRKQADFGKLPPGYYEAEIEGAATRIPIVVVPPRPAAPSRISTDAALSWCAPQERWKATADLLALAGVSWARDRITWGEVEPERGRFDWHHYDITADLQTERGINVYQVFHMCPAWARADHVSNRVPDDLRDGYEFGREAARHYHGRVKVWEVWNEADIPDFSNDPASEYAALLKAAYLGFKAGDPSVKVTQTSIALEAGRFTDDLADNGAADYYDIYNWHIYDDPLTFPTRIGGHHASMKRGGATGRPMWLTETGVAAPPIDGRISRSDQHRQADFIPKAAAMSLAYGTERFFFFLFTHYIENGREFGLFDEATHPYPGYAALATAVRAFGKGDYLGRIDAGRPDVHLHLFDSGPGETLVAWTNKDDAQATLPLAPGSGARTGIRRAVALDVTGYRCKRLSEHAGVATLQVGPSPIYLLLPHGTLQPLPPRPRQPETHPSSSSPLHGVVVRLTAPTAEVKKRSVEAFLLPQNGPLTLTIEVYNFGDRPVTGTVEIKAPQGWTLDRTTIPLTDLQPLDRIQQTLSLTAPAGPVEDRIRAELRDSAGNSSTPALVRFRSRD